MVSVPKIEYTSKDLVIDLSECPEERLRNRVEDQLLAAWNSAIEKGVFNYAPEEGEFRLVEGRFGISCQLNENRGRKRRKPESFTGIREPFNAEKWNFTRLRQEELLFSLERRTDSPHHAGGSGPLLVAVNASPISTGHSLLIPFPAKCLPQVLSADAVRAGIELALLVESAHFVVIFNSLLGLASVNHLHLQALFWPCKSGIAQKRVSFLSDGPSSSPLLAVRPPDWFAPAFVFQVTSERQIAELSRQVECVADLVSERRLAHNLFICRAPRFGKTDSSGKNGQLTTVYLFPRRPFYGGASASADCRSFFTAALELAGLLPVYDSDYLHSVGEEEALKVFEREALISDAQFEELVCAAFERLKMVKKSE